MVETWLLFDKALKQRLVSVAVVDSQPVSFPFKSLNYFRITGMPLAYLNKLEPGRFSWGTN